MKQNIENWDDNTAYFDTDTNLFYCCVCESSFDKLKDIKQHLIENGFIL